MTLATQTVQRFAEAALEEGFIELRNNPDHKRAKLVELTTKGNEVLDLLEARESDWAQSVVGKLSADEIQAAAETLAQLREQIVSSKNNVA